MENNIIDLEDLKSKLNLSEEQITELSNAFEMIMEKYEKMNFSSNYFYGVIDGINICHKIINGENDDYNFK